MKKLPEAWFVFTSRVTISDPQCITMLLTPLTSCSVTFHSCKNKNRVGQIFTAVSQL